MGWFRRRIEAVDRLIFREIAERRRSEDLEERDDILSLLVAARHEDGSPMSDAEMRDELLTLLVAGHETTATALSWAVERLSRHPDKLGRLREEVEAGEDAYLTATIQETLRLRPVISIVLPPPHRGGRDRRLRAPRRRLGRALRLPGPPQPRGLPGAARFLPERFLDNPPGTYTWIPFGGGVRRCLGASFAQFEMAVVLEELVKRHGIRPASPKPERVFRRAITETPRHNAEVILG